jgi:hypothetical protein
MRESVAPYAVAAVPRSTSPPTRKLAGHLLGYTCAAALWLNCSVDELWAHESYSHQAKQNEARPQEASPMAQRNRRQAHTKRREKTQAVREIRQSAGQKSHTKTTRKGGPEANSATKATRSESVQQSRSKASVRANLKTAHAKSGSKIVERGRPETKNATKAARSKAVRHSRSTASGRGNLKAAHAKSRTKTVEHRRPETKAASRARNQSNFAGHHHSAARTRSDRSTRAATDRRSRTKTGQHWQQHDKTTINHLAPTKSAEAVAVPMPSPRPTRPAQADARTAVVPDPELAVGSVPQAADAWRSERGPATYAALGPADQIPQPLQVPDRATILERDRLGMLELPKEIQDLMPKNPPPAQEVVNEARAYLIRTSTEQRERCVGDTMARQGVEVAIGRLHPVMAIRIARSIQQARNEGIPACVFSAFRPPAFGVGGFSDKFNSAHAYGIAVDFGGIDRPGSKAARKFQEIAASNGLYSLYGPGDRAEWNHYQLIPVRRIAPNNPLRDTITATGPKDEVAMWTKSGVPLDKVEPVAFRAENAIISARTKVSHHHSHHRQHMAAIKVAPLSPFVRVQHTTATKAVPLSPFERVM